jgi:arylsulfatase A-like enzyme
MGSSDCGAATTNIFVKQFINQRSRSDKPFFLFLNYMEAHAPYKNVPKKFLNRFVSREGRIRIKTTNQDRQKYLTHSIEMTEDDFDLLRSFYDTQISYLDLRMHELLDFLKRKGVFDHSMIIITSDHGDMIGEHCLMHHSYCIYDELIKVPIIIKLPGAANQSRSVEDMVSLINITPSIMELLNIKNALFSNQMQASCLPVSGGCSDNGYIFSECEWPKNEFEETYPEFDFTVYNKQYLTIRSREFKFIQSSDGRHELYDIENDPEERINLTREKPEKVKFLHDQLNQWYSSFDKVTFQESECPDLDEDVKSQLKALGYF